MRTRGDESLTVTHDVVTGATIYQWEHHPEAMLEITQDDFQQLGIEGCEKKFHEWCADCREYWRRGSEEGGKE